MNGRRRFSSIPPNPHFSRNLCRILEQVEQVGADRTGALLFGDQAKILVERGSICWVAISDTQQRLTDLLCQQRSPPLERERVEQVVSACKSSGSPVGEALVKAGLISESGLRAALFRHNVESLFRLVDSGLHLTEFVSHTHGTYDAKHTCSTIQVFAAFAARQQPALAAAARNHLDEVLVPDTAGLALLPDRIPEASVLAARGCERFKVAQILALAGWAQRLQLQVSEASLEADVSMTTWHDGMHLVLCPRGGLTLVLICFTRPAAARVFERLAKGSYKGNSS